MKLSEDMRGAVKLAAVTYGVSTHGGTVKALVKRGLAKDVVGRGFGATGTTVRLTDAGYRAAEEILREELEDRRAKGHMTAVCEREYLEVAARNGNHEEALKYVGKEES